MYMAAHAIADYSSLSTSDFCSFTHCINKWMAACMSEPNPGVAESLPV